MAGRVLTTDQLVTTLQRRAFLPKDSVAFSTQDFIDILNEEFDTRILKLLMENHEEYLVNECDIPVTTGAAQSVFRIPSRAIGNKLRGAAFYNVNGYITTISRVGIEDLRFFQKIGYQTYTFYVENDCLILTQTTISVNANYLRMYIYLRPSKLVANKYAATITNIDKTTGVITVDQIPSNFTANTLFDFTQANTPNRLYKFDVSASINSTTNTITIDPNLFVTPPVNTDISVSVPPLSYLVVGDYITAAEESIVPQIPTELHPILAQAAAVACLEALGDTQGLQNAQNKLVAMEQGVLDLLDNRVESAQQKCNNLQSPLSQQRLRYRRSLW
jgi:hypothetical protein